MPRTRSRWSWQGLLALFMLIEVAFAVDLWRRGDDQSVLNCWKSILVGWCVHAILLLCTLIEESYQEEPVEHPVSEALSRKWDHFKKDLSRPWREFIWMCRRRNVQL